MSVNIDRNHQFIGPSLLFLDRYKYNQAANLPEYYRKSCRPIFENPAYLEYRFFSISTEIISYLCNDLITINRYQFRNHNSERSRGRYQIAL